MAASVGVATIGALSGLVTGKRLGTLGVREGPDHLGVLADRCIAGEVAVHIDRTFALQDVVEALRVIGDGRALGKVVVVPGTAPAAT